MTWLVCAPPILILKVQRTSMSFISLIKAIIRWSGILILVSQCQELMVLISSIIKSDVFPCNWFYTIKMMLLHTSNLSITLKWFYWTLRAHQLQLQVISSISRVIWAFGFPNTAPQKNCHFSKAQYWLFFRQRRNQFIPLEVTQHTVRFHTIFFLSDINVINQFIIIFCHLFIKHRKQQDMLSG